MVPIRRGKGPGDKSSVAFTAAAESHQICDELAVKSHSLLFGVRALVTASSADGILVAAPRIRYRAAEVAELLTDLSRLVSSRSDYEWNNTMGAAKRNLTLLLHDLPSNSRSARSVMTGQSDKSPLVIAAAKLHDATARLKELTS